MDNKGINGSGLAHLWSKIKSVFATKTELQNGIAECQKPFMVTATADFVNGVLTNLSSTFDKIVEAYNRGDHIFLEVDISQLNGYQFVQKVLVNLTVYIDGSQILFEQIIQNHSDIVLISGIIYSDNSTAFYTKSVARAKVDGGLTFTRSNTAPTVDDRNVITFVVEG